MVGEEADDKYSRPSRCKSGRGVMVGSEDAILGCEVFLLEQEFLIDQPSDVRHANSRAHLLSGMRNIHHKLTPLT
jgi:hypothetical protein